MLRKRCHHAPSQTGHRRSTGIGEVVLGALGEAHGHGPALDDVGGRFRTLESEKFLVCRALGVTEVRTTAVELGTGS